MVSTAGKRPGPPFSKGPSPFRATKRSEPSITGAGGTMKLATLVKTCSSGGSAAQITLSSITTTQYRFVYTPLPPATRPREQVNQF